MNSNAQLVTVEFEAISAIVVIVLLWFSWDMRSILVSGRRKNELSIEGRWKEVEDHLKRTLKARRPFVWLHRRYLMPGNAEAQYALFLHKQGRDEEALAQADRAIRQIESKPAIFKSIHREGTFKTLCGALQARTLILGGLGRYNEAHEAAARLQRLTEGTTRPNSALALLEYFCGHLDDALTLAQAVKPGDVQYDSMRGLVSLVHTVKGEFDEALQVLTYKPSDVSKILSSAKLNTLSGTPEGAAWIESMQRKLAGVFPPAQWLKLARVYLAREEFENAVHALDEAKKSLGPEPSLQAVYCHYRAESFAALGKAGETESYIERMRAIVRQLPKRSLIRETHSAAGRAYLYLQRHSDALAELTKAHQVALHPIEKHTTAYWLARGHEAAGNLPEAMQYCRIVAADPIPSWMRKRASEALTQQKS